MGDRFRVLSSTSTRDLRYSISHPSSLDAIHQCSGKIHHHPTGEVTEELAAKYGVHRATLWRWAKTEVQVNEAQGTKRKKKVMSTVKRGVKLLFPLLEARLLVWFPDMRKNKEIGVTSQYLLLRAVHFEPEYLTGRSLDAAVEVADKFLRTITYNLEMVGLLAGIQGAGKYESVFNMDQTSISIDMGPKGTIEFVGAKHVDAIQGMSENSFRASVFLCASATGQKLLPFVVFAGIRGGPVHQELMDNRNYREGPIITVQKKAYCDEELMLEWINEVCLCF
ncbi:hypothetical protein JG688_00014202 [Phytophthora aleatoria]|uniref:DDE-1 domain-containing protein n=1 Tax=Phytophthora aleatoria TaxID=2496075 RepID=A0A8J5MDK3_9STRA|nr:hypothetical protein JG688_00014202 [Phytophthora aleatoria]